MKFRFLVTRTGIGDILTARDFLSSYMNNQDTYIVCYPSRITPARDSAHSKLLIDLHNSIFTEPNINLNFRTGHKLCDFGSSLGGNGLAFTMFLQEEGVKGVRKYRIKWGETGLTFNNIPSLCDNDNFQGDYAVITTRARITGGVDTVPNLYPIVKKTLDILNSNYSKIVIIGEKTQSKLHRNEFDPSEKSPSIYNFILQHINQDKMLDLTSKHISFNQFKIENTICRDAKKVVTFGCGGNYARQLYIGSNLSALMCGSCYDHPATKRLRSLKQLQSPNVEGIELFLYNNIDSTENFYKSLSE